jgi:hypothetical protein
VPDEALAEPSRRDSANTDHNLSDEIAISGHAPAARKRLTEASLPQVERAPEAEPAPPQRTPLDNLVNNVAKEIGLHVLAGLADSMAPGAGQVVRLLATGCKVVRIAEGLLERGRKPSLCGSTPMTPARTVVIWAEPAFDDLVSLRALA